jgi:hypothetical protein
MCERREQATADGGACRVPAAERTGPEPRCRPPTIADAGCEVLTRREVAPRAAVRVRHSTPFDHPCGLQSLDAGVEPGLHHGQVLPPDQGEKMSLVIYGTFPAQAG